MAITKKEIRSFWMDYACLMLNWTSLSILGFFSTAVVWAFILKHYCGVKQEFWLLNDTKDGDWGADWWLKKNRLKPSLWSAMLWWFRNHSWNWIRYYLPEWNGGGTEDFIVIKNTLQGEYGKWARANHKAGIYGTYYIAFRINGRVQCRYSTTLLKKMTIQIGAGGSEYRFRIKI